ncbi:DUF1772 domain-containing protein [Streptomyces sp. NPDC007264]|uniref:anthrone oxygenase family protein n=1 Tax=Streptomyces sp. NPDC007264 TaxID=3364777 RepID=UPI0036D99762
MTRTTPHGTARTVRTARAARAARTALADGVLAAATVATGLIAGAFLVFACAVMPALARSDDRVYIEVMQNVNDVIQNPVFLLPLVGAPLLTAVSAWQVRTAPHRRWIRWGLAAHGLAFLVTAFANVPLNDGLAHAGAAAHLTDPAAVRGHFEDAWVAWNLVRTLLCTLALVCLTRALLLRGGSHASAYFASAAGSSASR